MAETIEYSNQAEVKTHLNSILDAVVKHRFGKVEVFVADGEVTHIEQKLTFKLNRVKKRPQHS